MPKHANIKSCVEKRRNRREHRRYLCHGEEKPAGNSLHIGERSDLNPQVDLFRRRWRSGKRIRAVAKPRNFLHGRGRARKRCPKQANIKSCVEKRRNRREHRRYLCHGEEKPAGNSLHIGERSDLNPQVDLFRKRWRSGKRIRAVAKPRNFLHGRGKPVNDAQTGKY